MDRRWMNTGVLIGFCPEREGCLWSVDVAVCSEHLRRRSSSLYFSRLSLPIVYPIVYPTDAASPIIGALRLRSRAGGADGVDPPALWHRPKPTGESPKADLERAGFVDIQSPSSRNRWDGGPRAATSSASAPLRCWAVGLAITPTAWSFSRACWV